MGLRELITALEDDAEADLARRRAATGAEVKRIRAAADAEASGVRARALTEARDAAVIRSERALLAVRARSAAGLRRAREDELEAVLGQVHSELDSLRRRPSYRAQLDAMLQEALTALPEADRVHVDPRDAELVADLLARAGNPARLINDLQCGAGVVVASPGRRIDNTVESRLAAAWPRLRSVLAARWDSELDRGGGGDDGR